MARAIKLIEAPIGLFEVDGILVLKTQYCTRNEDGTVTADCYIVESGEYFWGGVDNAEERNNLMVMPVDMPIPTPPNEWVRVEERLPRLRENVLVCAYWHEHWGVYMGWNSGHGWSVSCGLGQRSDVQVSHWMPLPEPPGKEG